MNRPPQISAFEKYQQLIASCLLMLILILAGITQALPDLSGQLPTMEQPSAQESAELLQPDENEEDQVLLSGADSHLSDRAFFSVLPPFNSTLWEVLAEIPHRPPVR